MPVRMGRESGVLLLQMALAAGGAQHLVHAGPTHQPLELISAVVTQIFKNWHKI